MNLKKLMVIAAIGASTLGTAAYTMHTATAQGGKPQGSQKNGQFRERGQRGKRMMERMEKELNLTSAQKARIQTIMKESRTKSQKIRENQSLSPEQKRAQMKSNREATMKRVNTVLTPQQRQKLASMRKEMEVKRRQNGGGFGGGPRRNS